MPDEKGKLTPKELRDRWKKSPGKEFRVEIIKQLQNEETGRRVDWENLSVNVNGKEYLWIDFPGVGEIKEKLVKHDEYIFPEKIWPYLNSNSIYGDLRGINLEETELPDVLLACTQCNGVFLWKANLEGADLSFANLEGANLSSAHLEGVKLRSTNLEGADLISTNLEGARLWCANLEDAHLSGAYLKRACFSSANLKGAHFRRATLIGAYLLRANLEGAYLMGANLERACLWSTRLGNADLTDARFYFKSWWWRVKEFFIKTHIISHKRPTLFAGCELKNVKLDSDPVLYRELLDEQYLDRFAERHKILYPFWLLTSNCGRSTLLVFAWAFIIAGIFGFIYPHTRFIYFGDINAYEWWYPFYLSFVTMTTLGMASVEPVTTGAAFWHTIENILGYGFLGYAIAVLGSKFTRRSA